MKIQLFATILAGLAISGLNVSLIGATSQDAPLDTGNTNGLYQGELVLEAGKTLNKHGKWFYDKVRISSGATLYVDSYDENKPGTGSLEIYANDILVEGEINGVGRGYQGSDKKSSGGGGGRGRGAWRDGWSQSYGENGGTGNPATTGDIGRGEFYGIGGVGFGASHGNTGEYFGYPQPGGGGTKGSGAGIPGEDGGYANWKSNGDNSEDLTLRMGSSGGSGGGGAGGGGGGGSPQGDIFNVDGHNGGNGGGGGKGGKGGNGGAMIKLLSVIKMRIHGKINFSGKNGENGEYGSAGGGGEPGSIVWVIGAKCYSPAGGAGGAGGTGSPGGSGAGGGVLLYYPGAQPNEDWLTGTVTSLGGGGIGSKNGGTVKIFSPNEPLAAAARVMAGRYFFSNKLPGIPLPKNLAATIARPENPKTVRFSATIPSKGGTENDYSGTIYLEVSETPDFSTITFSDVIEKLNQNFNTKESNPHAFDHYGGYYWRAWFEDLSGDWESNPSRGLCSMKTAPIPFDLGYPTSPQLVSPPDRSRFKGKEAKFSVISPIHPEMSKQGRVNVQWSRSSSFNNSVSPVYEAEPASKVGQGDRVEIQSIPLEPGDYYWRSYVVDDNNVKTDYSQIWSFNIAEPLPETTSFRVVRNVIGKDNQECDVQIDLAETMEVKAVLYDVLGGKIKEIIPSTVLQAGNHTYAWDGKNSEGQLVPPGIYFLNVTSNNNSHRFKIGVIR